MRKTTVDTTSEGLARAKAWIARRVAGEHGQNRGRAYVPWLEVRDVPSEGLSTRAKGWKSQRVHHFLSGLELNYFYCLEFSDDVVEVREQYPLLPLEETMAIAEQAGIKHPFDYTKQMPAVMTTDFLVTTGTGMVSSDCARTVKPAAKLADRRVIEKFEIERRYWERRNTNWGIVTEREIPSVLAKNVFWMHADHDLTGCGVTHDQLRRIETTLRPQLLTGGVERQEDSLSEICARCDDLLCLTIGDTIKAVRHLLARKIWRTEMFQPIEVGKPLRLQGVYPDKLVQLIGLDGGIKHS